MAEHRRLPQLTPAMAAALAAMLGLAVGSWVVAVRQMNGMGMGVATGLGSFAFFVVLWVVMMAAMVPPGAAPAVLRRARIGGRVPQFIEKSLAGYLTRINDPRHSMPDARSPSVHQLGDRTTHTSRPQSTPRRGMAPLKTLSWPSGGSR